MSEINALPVQLTANQLVCRLRALAFRVGNRVHDFRGDDLEPVRSILLSIVGELDNIAEGVKPAVGSESGEDTVAMGWAEVPGPRHAAGGQFPLRPALPAESMERSGVLREIGAHTREGIRRMGGNRGPWGLR